MDKQSPDERLFERAVEMFDFLGIARLTDTDYKTVRKTWPKRLRDIGRLPAGARGTLKLAVQRGQFQATRAESLLQPLLGGLTSKEREALVSEKAFLEVWRRVRDLYFRQKRGENVAQWKAIVNVLDSVSPDIGSQEKSGRDGSTHRKTGTPRR